MKTYQELKSTGIDFNSLENERQKALQYRKNKSMPAWIIGFVSIVIGIIFLFISIIIGIAILILGLMVALVYYVIINSNAENQIKSKIMNVFFEKLNMDLVYGDTSKWQEFKNNAAKAGFTSIRSEDYISGSLNGQPFIMGDVKMSSENNDDETNITVFQGPIGFIQTSDNYPHTTISPGKLKKVLGKLIQKNIYFDKDLDFEKDFVVWSKDEDFAKNILTAPLRQYLKAMATTNHDIYVVLTDNIIMAGIDIDRDLFKLSLKKPIDDAELSSMYDDFAKFYQFIENIYSLVTTGVTSFTEVSQPTDNIPPKPSKEVPPPPSF